MLVIRVTGISALPFDIGNQNYRLLAMCIIFFAFEARADYPLILAANRDEFYNRPTAAADSWGDAPEIFAGRDLVGGGTWLGVTRSGRFAAVTNYRDPAGKVGTHSRGALVADFCEVTNRPGNIWKELAHMPIISRGLIWWLVR